MGAKATLDCRKASRPVADARLIIAWAPALRASGDGLSAQSWIDRAQVVPVARAARQFAGANPDLSTATATAAVHRSARRDADAGRHCESKRIYQGRLSVGCHPTPTMALSR
jgi:hypothetical protein